VGVTLFRVPMVYLLSITLSWGLAGVWFGTTLDWTARATVSYFLYRRGLETGGAMTWAVQGSTNLTLF
jgi:Na+-driven multidrug efflux pump